MAELRETEYVWLIEEAVIAKLLTLGAHHSVVEYRREGNIYQTFVTNDEFIFRTREEVDDAD
jgi:hypothetical protein